MARWCLGLEISLDSMYVEGRNGCQLLKLVEVEGRRCIVMKETCYFQLYPLCGDLKGYVSFFTNPSCTFELEQNMGGSQIVWIAPSGGRDRPDPATGEWYPAPFDAASLDNLRRLGEHSAAPGHIYPLALLCHNIMPPPPQVEKEIGEKRMISFHGTGLSVAPKITFSDITASCQNPEEAREVYAQAVYDIVTEQYNVLKSAIHYEQGLNASTPNISLSQPWS